MRTRKLQRRRQWPEYKHYIDNKDDLCRRYLSYADI